MTSSMEVLHARNGDDDAAARTIFLEWLRRRGVPWSDESTSYDSSVCVERAVALGAMPVLEWLLDRGATMNKNSVLMGSFRILANSRIADPVGRFREVVLYLLERGAAWSFLCLRLAIEVTDDSELLRWLAEKGAPFHEELFSPGDGLRLRRLLSLRKRGSNLHSDASVHPFGLRCSQTAREEW